MRLKLVIFFALIAVSVIFAAGYFLFRGLPIEIVRGDFNSDIKTQEIIKSQVPIRQQLIDAGLNIVPTLGDIGVNAHMDALEKGDIDQNTLIEYANNLIFLKQNSAELGQELPIPFFDVQTEQMHKYGWTPYKIVENLVQPDNAPYIKLLATSFGRFLRFKENEDKFNSPDTALDAALDMFEFAKNYLAEIPEDHRAQHLHGTSNHAQAIILTWQTLVAGSTRNNPLTRQPVYSHGFVSRFNVSTIYQYYLNRGMSLSKAWGVSGFAKQFVGPDSNSNQVEHMSISIMLQAVLGEPLFILNGLEREKQLTGQAPADEAKADMMLNSVIWDVFIPKYAENLDEAVMNLRVSLTSR